MYIWRAKRKFAFGDPLDHSVLSHGHLHGRNNNLELYWEWKPGSKQQDSITINLATIPGRNFKLLDYEEQLEKAAAAEDCK
jgi:hypothetical protein